MTTMPEVELGGLRGRFPVPGEHDLRSGSTHLHRARHNDVYVAGRGGLVYRWNGSSWTQLSTGVSVELRDIRGTSSTDIWAVGEAGTILHYDGSAVTVHDSGTLTTLESVWPAGPSDVFATGGDTLLHYDGTQWVPVRDGTGDDVTDIVGTGPYMFGVGRAGGTELLIRY